MALFVDLEDEDVDESPNNLPPGRLLWSTTSAALDNGYARPPYTASRSQPPDDKNNTNNASHTTPPGHDSTTDKAAKVEEAHEPPVNEIANWNSMTEALGCYPVAAAIASSIDLNTLDSLSRTCRQIHSALLQFRKPLLASTLHCINEDLPVDGEETLRYRARAGNWYYMEDTGRTNYGGKSGQCARDMVSECRRCGTVVCRNCAIKPPAPIVLRDRHRRLCDGCVKAPLATLAKPPLPCDTPLHSDLMQRAICICSTEGVWLCQPCGRSIRGDDQDYRAIWKWRTQYGEVLGGTGIGEGDRGVICGREQDCCNYREVEQETDCDAEDAREAEGLGMGSSYGSSPSPSSTGSLISLASSPPVTAPTSSPWSIPIAPATQAATTVGSPLYSPEVASAVMSRRTPSPAFGPGYARHEIEGIGGVVKRKRVKMVRVGACVHDWEDELARGAILEREITGRARSWCGWCWRPIPSKKDVTSDGLGKNMGI